MSFFSFDLDLMTLILKLEIDMVMMHLFAENEVPSCISSKNIARTDGQTDRPD